MEIIYTGKKEVTYSQWMDRISGFAINSNRLTSQYFPINKNLKPRISINVKSIIDGFNSVVTYSQLQEYLVNEFEISRILEGENAPEPIYNYSEKKVFTYSFIKDREETQAMLDSVDGFITSDIKGLNRYRKALQILVTADIMKNEVFNFKQDEWEIILK